MAADQEWADVSPSVLMDHIVATHHAYINRQLPLLAGSLLAHAREYWRRYPQFLTAHTEFAVLRAALEQHLLREETTAVPLLAAWSRDSTTSLAPFAGNIDDHIREHAAARGALDKLRETLWGYTSQDGQGPEVAYTFAQLGAFENDLVTHVHLEDDILFPQVRHIADAR